VQQLDLVSAVWPDVGSDSEGGTAGVPAGSSPAREEQRPETLLYALLGGWPCHCCAALLAALPGIAGDCSWLECHPIGLHAQQLLLSIPCG
jgi:hypothetical protein